MAKLYFQNGKIISRNGNLGTNEGCCCGGVPASGLNCNSCDVSAFISDPSLKGAYCAINDSYYMLASISPSTICFGEPIPHISSCNDGTIAVRFNIVPVTFNSAVWSFVDAGGLGGAGRGNGQIFCNNDGNWTFSAAYGDGGTTLSPPFQGRSPGYFTGSPIGYLSVSYTLTAILTGGNNTSCNINGISGNGIINYTHRQFNFGTVPGDPLGRFGFWLDRECSQTTSVTVTISRALAPCFPCEQ
jgi:hypothetical protein